MEIQSAFNAGVQGFSKAKQDASEAATAIASETAYTAETLVQRTEANDSAERAPSPDDLPSLNQEVVNLKVAEFQAKASREVIKSADETLGTILDVTV